MKYDRRKALHALLYLCDHLPKPVDVYTALKVIYFADKAHLERFGRAMFGETYIAMDNGPVPSGAYDIIKYVSGRAKYDLEFPEAHSALYATKTEVVPKQRPNLDLLSRSELTCLTQAAREIGGLTFEQLKRLSHDEAWKRADKNGEIELEDIVRTLPNGELVSAHLGNRTPGEEAPMERKDPVAAPKESVDV